MSVEGLSLFEQVSDDQILSIIRASFGRQAEIVGCRPIHGGHCNTLYDIETLNPAHHVVLRIAPSDDLPLRNERTMMLAEPVKYDLISRAGVPTAQVLAVDGSRSVIDRDYLIVNYIDAVPMNHPSVPADARPHIMREVGRYTALTHGISADKFGWVMPDGSIRGSESWAEVFGELMVETYTNCREAEIISSADADTALGCYWNHRAVFDECRVPAFVHNDIWDPNVLVKQKDGAWQIEAIIDADGALFADREFEFVLWEGVDQDFMLGYGKQVDPSPNAALRRKFYRMQLYMQYSWFYLVLTPGPEFQASAKKIAMDILQDMRP